MGVAPLAQPGKHAAISVMHDKPFKPRRLAVELMQGRHRPVQPVEIADQALDAGMPRVFQQVPVEGVIVLPFICLSELAAHEQQLLAGMTEHEAVIGAQIGEALPLVAGHASENGALPMHDLIMGEGQDEVLEECVVQTKQDLAMVVLAVDRVLADVIERVVHPAHVPFVAESQAAPIHRPRYHGPGGRFLRRRGGVGKAREHFRIDTLDEADRFQILTPAVFVRDPAALGPAVIEVQHRGDRIHAQSVDAVPVQPE